MSPCKPQFVEKPLPVILIIDIAFHVFPLGYRDANSVESIGACFSFGISTLGWRPGCARAGPFRMSCMSTATIVSDDDFKIFSGGIKALYVGFRYQVALQ